MFTGSLLVLLAASSAQAQPAPPRYADTVKELVEGTVRGLALTAFVAEQHQKGLATWKRVFLSTGPGHHETVHLLLYGKVTGRALPDVGATLEKHYNHAAKALGMLQDEPWQGKLSVFLVNDRPGYQSFIRVVEQRKVEDGERGSFLLDEERSVVVAGPPLSKVDLPVDVHAGEQIAAALLFHQGGAKVPSWILEGFGRATVRRAGTLAGLSAEHRKAAQYAIKNKRNVRDVISSPLADDEATILRASVMEFLAYDGGSARFVQFARGFRPTETVAEPTLDVALKAANISLDRLDTAWQKWVRSFK